MSFVRVKHISVNAGMLHNKQNIWELCLGACVLLNEDTLTRLVDGLYFLEPWRHRGTGLDGFHGGWQTLEQTMSVLFRVNSILL